MKELRLLMPASLTNSMLGHIFGVSQRACHKTMLHPVAPESRPIKEKG
jgi:hypothetical protein